MHATGQRETRIYYMNVCKRVFCFGKSREPETAEHFHSVVPNEFVNFNAILQIANL